jgi:hypothetical protein
VRSRLPKEISLDFIARMNREYGKAILKNTVPRAGKGGDWGTSLQCAGF